MTGARQLLFWQDAIASIPVPAFICKRPKSPRLEPFIRESWQKIPLVLASASPAKRDVLQMLGLRFKVDAADIDERAVTFSDPDQLVAELSKRKATAVALRNSNALVLGADTVVVDDYGILGKPKDAVDAKHILARLSGKTHRVVTGLHLIGQDSGPDERVSACRVATSVVTFRFLTEETIERYVATREPLGKAGAYGLQGTGALLVQKVEGEYTNVFGMPIVSFVDALAELGCELI
jgi:septum formation protein